MTQASMKQESIWVRLQWNDGQPAGNSTSSRIRNGYTRQPGPSFQSSRTQIGSLALVAILSATGVLGQSQYGTIRGVLLDGSGAVVTGARVKASNQQTGLGFETQSNEIGEYTIGGLLPGMYRVTAEASGFKTVQAANRELGSGALMRVDLRLEVGEVTQAVTVEDRGALINTETATVAAQMPTQLLDRPPTLRHLSWNPAETAAAFLPGQNYGGGTAISAYGGRSYDRKVTLDGAQINSPNCNTRHLTTFLC